MHAQGKGRLKQDVVEAARWYALAAAQKYPVAQYALGFMYEHGKGVVQDDTKAVELYTLAAEQGFALAQSNLGAMHASWKGGLPQDFAQAAMWWKLAADQGEEPAMNNLRIVLDKHLFPPGTAVKLVGMKAAILDGKRGVVVGPAGGGALSPALGKVMVRMDENGRMQATCFENLERVCM
jgi:TPR repeat protein